MEKWWLIKDLLKSISFNFRKFIFFLSLAIAGLFFYFIFKANANVGATIDFTSINQGGGQVEMDVQVLENGQVFVNGIKQNQTLNFYDQYDELKIIVFNAPGYFIENFNGVVHLPKPIAQKDLRQLIYAIHGVGSYHTSIQDEKTLIYQANAISPQAILTIVADFPKGYLVPTLGQRITIAFKNFPIKDWLFVALILPAMTMIALLIMILQRRSDQLFIAKEILSNPPTRDPPAVVGVLVNGAIGAREIAATLIDLARRGIIFIIYKGPSGFSFGKRRAGDFQKMSDLATFEKALLDKIFLPLAYKSTASDVEMRIGRHIFSRKIAQFYLGVYNLATRQGYFVRNPVKVHLMYKYLGVILFFLSFLGFVLGVTTGADPKAGLFFWAGGIAASFVMVKLSPYMPARSKLGREALKKWLAFRNFLLSQSRLPAKEVIQAKFEEYLPFAIVLGAEVEWAKRYHEEPFCNPPWYESAETTVTLESFISQFFPFIGYVADNLAKSHEPTVE